MSNENNRAKTKYEDSTQVDREALEAVKYDYPGRETNLEIIFPEFTSVCPWTGMPDFATLYINYVPREHCVEFKALKYYLTSFRNVGILQEHAVNQIRDDLVELLEPVSLTITGEFNPRGGMKTVIKVSYP